MVRKLLDKYISSYQNEEYFRWAIIDKESDECIGQIAYFLVDSKNHFAEIEYSAKMCIRICRSYKEAPVFIEQKNLTGEHLLTYNNG